MKDTEEAKEAIMEEAERGLAASGNIPVAKEDQIDAAYCIKFLSQIRDVAFATVDEDGLPSVRIIDVMYADDKRLYFLTPRGKAFYSDLMRSSDVAIVGQTTDFRTCRLRGRAIHPDDPEEQKKLVDWMFSLNPEMELLYPGRSRYVIEVFYIEDGEGEYFDLGQKPILRKPFILGDCKDDISKDCYFITDACTGCARCTKACPQKCIMQKEDGKYKIIQSECMRCGLCMEVCPFDAIEKGSADDR